MTSKANYLKNDIQRKLQSEPYVRVRKHKDLNFKVDKVDLIIDKEEYIYFYYLKTFTCKIKAEDLMKYEIDEDSYILYCKSK